MAERDYLPDEWSDHDFFVVVRDGAEERFRSDLSWLPLFPRIVFSFRETRHGAKALYDDGHLVELAVFRADELAVARVNRFRVLIDRETVGTRMADVAKATRKGVETSLPDDRWLRGQFLTALLVGTGRFARGERLAGTRIVKAEAVGHLLQLLARQAPAAEPGLLDDLDPWRRFERAFPALGGELGVLLAAATPRCAAGLLLVARRELRADAFPDWESAAGAVFRRLEDGAPPARSG